MDHAEMEYDTGPESWRGVGMRGGAALPILRLVDLARSWEPAI